jgi:uncharacterized protein YbjT (DUF2867 family)
MDREHSPGIMSDPVLVLGATGTHGGAVAHALLARKFTVHALVRDPNSARAQALAEAGAKLVAGDLLDEDSLVRAFSDVGAVYAVTTPFEHGAEDEHRLGFELTRYRLEVKLTTQVLPCHRRYVGHEHHQPEHQWQ